MDYTKTQKAPIAEVSGLPNGKTAKALNYIGQELFAKTYGKRPAHIHTITKGNSLDKPWYFGELRQKLIYQYDKDKMVFHHVESGLLGWLYFHEIRDKWEEEFYGSKTLQNPTLRPMYTFNLLDENI